MELCLLTTDECSKTEFVNPDGGMKYAINNIPKLCYIDNDQRSRVLSRGCALHVFLGSENGLILSKPNQTHFHYPKGSIPTKELMGQSKLVAITSYNRGIIVEFENGELCDQGLRQLSSQKFSYGTSILRPTVEKLRDTAASRDTVWSVQRSKDDHSHSVHEVLRRFFCMEGAVKAKVCCNPAVHLSDKDANGYFLQHIYRDPYDRTGRARLILNDDLPVWMDKIVSEARQANQQIFEIRIAGGCELCSKRALMQPQVMSTDLMGRSSHLHDGSVPTGPRGHSFASSPLEDSFHTACSSLRGGRTGLTMAVAEVSTQNLSMHKRKLDGEDLCDQSIKQAKKIKIEEGHSKKGEPRDSELLVTEVSTQPPSTNERKLDGDDQRDQSIYQEKRADIEEGQSGRREARQDKISAESDCFLESLVNELEDLKERRALLLGLRA